jgi:hypothetical protein
MRAIQEPAFSVAHTDFEGGGNVGVGGGYLVESTGYRYLRCGCSGVLQWALGPGESTKGR